MTERSGHDWLIFISYYSEAKNSEVCFCSVSFEGKKSEILGGTELTCIVGFL